MIVTNQDTGVNGLKFHFSVLSDQTVDSLFNDFSKEVSNRVKDGKNEEFNIFIQDVIRLTKNISPSLVEKKDFSELLKLAEKLPLFFDSEQTINAFFNTLNLCVVGLGSALKGGKHNE